MSLSKFFKKELSQKYQVSESSIKRLSKHKFDSCIIRSFSIKNKDKIIFTYNYDGEDSEEFCDYGLIEKSSSLLTVEQMKLDMIEKLKQSPQAISNLFYAEDIPENFKESIFHTTDAWDMISISKGLKYDSLEVRYNINLDFCEKHSIEIDDEVQIYAILDKAGSKVIDIRAEG